MHSLTESMHRVRISSVPSPIGGAGAGGAGFRSESESPALLLPRASLAPFMDPKHVVHGIIPVAGSPSAYLEAVRQNILAEYSCFIESARPVTHYDVDIAASEDGLQIVSASAPAPRATGGTEAAAGAGKRTEVQLIELHNHIVVLSARLYLLILGKSGKLTMCPGADWPAWSRWRPGLGTHVAPTRSGGRAAGVIADIGFIGDSINEYAACQQHLIRLTPDGSTALLTSVADPTKRKVAMYQPPVAADGSGRIISASVPINARQRELLEGLRYDVEAIQGPPGTGKSTLIYHIINSFAPRDGVALATCVQNKAVDAIAEKLAASGDVRFFVFGNAERLGLLAQQWTLPAQVRRDQRVVAAAGRLTRMQKLLTLVAGFVKRGTERRPGVRHAAYMRRQAAARFGDPRAAATDRERERVEAASAAWLARDPWARAWAAYFRSAHPRQVAAAAALRGRVADQEAELARTEAAARLELIAAARAVLCTVATASRSLLSEAEVVPAVSRITTAILDEAGTCPEPKLPLLLLLPRLARVVSVGDQKQLAPFTLWQPPRGGSGHHRAVCRFHLSRAGCNKGARCPFSHALAAPAAASSARPNGPSTEPTGFFQRLDRALAPTAAPIPSLLDQYRMHPAISAYVSAAFYGGTLRTPAAVAAARSAADARGLHWLAYARPAASASGGAEEEPDRSTSKCNPTEAALALKVWQDAAAAGDLRARSVMVITFYKAQEALLKRTFQAAGILEAVGPVGGLRILTVDQAQGSEADVVILSAVRSNAGNRVGFVDNPNRLNVAVSRARERLVVIGDADTLTAGPGSPWAALRASCAVSAPGAALPPMA